MPFETVETFTKAKMPPSAKISYMRPTGRGANGGKAKADAKPQLKITVPTTIAGVSKAETFILLVGTGEDAGKIRIRGLAPGQQNDAAVKPAELKHALVFRFGYVPRLGDDIFDGESRPVKKIGDDEFEITVPESWFAVQEDTDLALPNPITRKRVAA